MNIDPHSINIPGNLVIPVTENAIAFRFKPLGAFCIAGAVDIFAMLRAIDFDNKLGGHAGEIRNVGSDDDLPPEVTADHRVPSQVKPQPRFCFGRISTHAARR